MKDRVAVVTGAGEGLGKAIALALAAEGSTVVTNDHKAAAAAAVAGEIAAMGGHAVANSDSVATVEGGESIIKAAIDGFGRLDILVNAAAIRQDRPFLEMSEEDWDAVINFGLKGAYCVCRPAAIEMRRRRFGRIVNLTSDVALLGAEGQANFVAAKAGLLGLTRVLAREMGRNAITTNAVAAVSSENAAPPEQVAAMVVYLTTEEAWNVNGKVFYVAAGSISLAYEEDMGRALNKDGMWSVAVLAAVLPLSLLQGVAGAPVARQG